MDLNVYLFPAHAHVFRHHQQNLEAKRCRTVGIKDPFLQNPFLPPKPFSLPQNVMTVNKVFLDSTKNKQKKQFFFLFTFCLSFFSFILWLFLLGALISCLQKIVPPYIKTKNSMSHEIRPYYNYDMKTSTFSHRIFGSVAIVTNKI